MIRPQHHERVFRVCTFVERIQHQPDAAIDKLRASQICRHRLVPAFGFQDSPVIQRRLVHVPRDFQPGRRQVRKVVRLDPWQHHARLGVALKIFLWSIKRHVRQANPHRHEKRLPEFALQRLRRPLGVDHVAKLLLRQINRAKIANTNPWQARDRFHPELLVPGIGTHLKIVPLIHVRLAVINLPPPEHMITAGLEIGRQRHRTLERRSTPERLVQFVHARSGRAHPGQQAHAGRIADWRLAMRVTEQHTALGQAIDVWRGHLWMAAKTTHPVV